MNRLILSFLLAGLLCFNEFSAQVGSSFTITDWQTTDIQGQNWTLSNALNADHVVLVYFFNTADITSWDFYQSGILQQLNTNLGVDAGGYVEWVMVETNPYNGIEQLIGPESLSGNDSTQTWGDWISENPATLLDDAAWADSLDLIAAPYLMAICPNYHATIIPIADYSTMLNAITQIACPPLSVGVDAALSQLSISRSCGSEEVSLSFVLTNRGTEPLDSCAFQTLNLSGATNYVWTGFLDSYASDTLTWNGLSLVNDDPIFLIQSGIDANTLNDTLSAISDIGLSMHYVQLELNLDAFPEEVSWELRNQNDSILFSGSDYSVPYQYINQVYHLPENGCYRFILNDASGDGLHGSQWGGFDGFCYLRSLDDDGLFVTSELYGYDGSYNFTNEWNTPASQSAQFEVGSALGVLDEQRQENHLALYPNPTSEEMHVVFSNTQLGKTKWTIYDMQGQLHAAGEFDVTSAASMMTTSVSNLADGTYLFLTEDAHGASSRVIFSILH